MKKIISTILAVVFVFSMLLDIVPSAKAAATLDYHAYMCIQSNNDLWIFRDEYDHPKHGFGTEAFDGLHTVSGSILTDYAGTFTDANLTEDGTYTVKLDKPDFATETTMSLLYVSTDIPMSSSLKVTDVIVKVDGKTLYTFDNGLLNPESLYYAQIMCLNAWNPDVAALFSNSVPTNSCEITFTISGLEKAKADKETVKDYTFKMFKDHAAVSGYTGSSNTLKLPTAAYGKSVTEIYTNAFKNSKVKSVTIPAAVTKIGNYAFAGTKLDSYTISKAITSIGDGAFSSCTGCTKFTVAKGNTAFTVKDGVLYSKDMKTLVQYPAGKSGTSFTVPSSVTKIQGGAFAGCTKLTKITVSSTVKTIGKDAFTGCTKVTLYAPSGSAAYTYAVKNGIKVKKS